jgi:hypothetical protein
MTGALMPLCSYRLSGNNQPVGRDGKRIRFLTAGKHPTQQSKVLLLVQPKSLYGDLLSPSS